MINRSKVLSLSETLTNNSENQTMLPASADTNITDRKVLLTISFLLINALVWLLMTISLLKDFVGPDQNIIWFTYYASIILSGFVGAFFSKKVNRFKFILVWTLLGMSVSLLPIIVVSPTFSEMLLIAILFGFAGGVGMPSVLGYFADSTKITNRGLVSGVAFLGINFVGAVLGVLFTGLGLFVSWIILSVWRGTGLIVFFLKPVDQKPSTKTFRSSFISIVSEKAFYLYFVAWFLFMLVDRSEAPTVRFLLDNLDYDIIAPIIGSVSCLVAGVLADRIGRKRVIITGFVIYGIAYALIGLMPGELIARYIFITIEAISTGILWVSFILILWGDLSEFGSREKYYALGLIPFFLTNIIELFSGPIFQDIPNESAFTLAVFFLFMALLPLFLAPETVPEKNIELRRLKSFAEEAKKEREKFETKN